MLVEGREIAQHFGLVHTAQYTVRDKDCHANAERRE
jgi:hypothetical protein